MSSIPQNNNNQEIDLSQIYKKIGVFFENIPTAIFRIFLFFKKKSHQVNLNNQLNIHNKFLSSIPMKNSIYYLVLNYIFGIFTILRHNILSLSKLV